MADHASATSELTLTPAMRRRSLIAAIACISVAGIAMGLTYPLLSLILEARGTSRTVIGLNAAMPALATLIFAPAVPRLVRLLGFKPFIFTCLVTEASIVLLLKAFDFLGAWFALRFILGMSGVGLFVASETWINQVAEEARRGRLIAVYNMVLAGGFAVGPLIIPITGIEGWLPFIVGAVFITLASLPMLWSGPGVPTIRGRSSFGVLAFLRVAPTLATAVLVFAAIESAAGSLLPVYGVRSGLDTQTAAVMLTMLLVGSLAWQWPVGWLADKGDRYLLMALCGLAGALGAALLPVVTGEPRLLWSMLFVWGGLTAGIYTVAMTILGERFKGAELATASAAFGLLWGLGSLAGPPLAGAAMDLWDPDGFAATLAAACLVFVLVAGIRGLGRRGRP